MTSDDQTECPLCMEPLEVDDLSFYPCTCGYQICRFCWHRLKTDGNGLCPACRKPYSENPAHFEPLSEDEIVRIKKERRQKEVQKKQKLSENRRHLADVRVVQKNLVFIVGLSQRLADTEVLKKMEYFGKFGKILKVVINPSPSYAGTQIPSASAYVTYSKPEEALRAIQTVNNIQIDNRTLKASLGTTKYCSHFLKSTYCPKTDCMYLHDFGEDAASFTKEEMSQGKHLEYESKLIETILHIPRNLQNIDSTNILNYNWTSTNNTNTTTNTTTTTNTSTNSLTNGINSNGTSIQTNTNSNNNNNNNNSNNNTNTNTNTVNTNNYDNKNDIKMRHKTNKPVNSNSSTNQNRSSKTFSKVGGLSSLDKLDDIDTIKNSTSENNYDSDNIDKQSSLSSSASSSSSENRDSRDSTSSNDSNPINSNTTTNINENKENDEIKNTNLDDQNNDAQENNNIDNNIINIQQTGGQINSLLLNGNNIISNNSEINNDNDTIMSQTNNFFQEEDLGFDPWCESSRALQDLMKIEKTSTSSTSSINDAKKLNYLSQQSATATANTIAQQQQQQQINPITASTNQLYNSNISNKNILSHIEFLQKQFQSLHNLNNNNENINKNLLKNSTTTINNNTPTPNLILNNNNNDNNNSNINNIGNIQQLKLNHQQQQQFNSFAGAYELLSAPLKNLINTNLYNAKLASLQNGGSLFNQDIATAHTQTTPGAPQNFNDLLLKTNQTHLLNQMNPNTNNLNARANGLTNGNSTNNPNGLIRNGGAPNLIVPPPGFNLGGATANNYQTSSSSTTSSSSSAASSVENSASSTPALNGNKIAHSANSFMPTGTENMLDSRLYDKTSIQANFQNSQFGLLDEQVNQNDNFSKNLHKTLKSILPNANISFGAINTNANFHTNMPNTNLTSNLNRNGLNYNNNINNSNNNSNNNNKNNNNSNNNNTNTNVGFWPDDPAIVSLTDRSHLLQNGNLTNGASQFQSLNDFHLANSNNINNNASSNNGNRAISPLSNNKNTINNMKLNNQRGGLVNNLINSNQKLNDNSAEQLLNSHQYLLQNFNNLNVNSNSVNGKLTIDENLNLNLAQNTPFLYRFQSFNNDTNNNMNSLLSNGLNDQLNLINQEANLTNLNLASLTLQQQFFMQQLSANFSSKKLPSE